MFRLETTKLVWEELAKDRECNAPLLNVVERDCHEDVTMIRDSVRIRDKISKAYLFSAADWGELDTLLEDAGEALDTFMINTGIYNEEVQRKFPLAMISEYDLYVTNTKENPHCSRPIEDFEITNLDLDWLDFIMDRYKNKEFGHQCYITDRLLYGRGLGLQYKGEKAAFVLQHKNGETGAFLVEEKFRGRGLGSELLKHFNEVLFEKNSILFSLVERHNIAAARAMVNGGYKKVRNNVIWVYQKNAHYAYRRTGKQLSL